MSRDVDFKPLTAEEVRCLGYAVRAFSNNFNADRNQGNLTPTQRQLNHNIRRAKSALRKVRELKGQGL